MKKQISMFILMVLLITLLISCGYDEPKLNDKQDPFIIEKIERYNSNLDTYYSQPGKANHSGVGVLQSRIVLPKNSFNIGDTIIFKK